MGDQCYSDTLYHHGIRGMKWGIRRFQNKDGSLTSTGKKRRRKDGGESEEKPKKPEKKKISDMSDDELKTKINRLQLEKQAYELTKQVSALNPKQVSAGKRFMNSLMKDVVGPAAKDASKNLVTDLMKKNGVDLLGLKEKSDPFKDLQKEVETLKLKKTKTEIEDYYAKRKERNNKKDRPEKPDSEEKNKSGKRDNDKSETGGRGDSDYVYEGTVFGKGQSSRNGGKEDVVDAEWREVNSDVINRGQQYILGLPDPPKNR